MSRMLFCQLGPWAYRVSAEKEILRRQVQDLKRGPFAGEKAEPLPALIYRHQSLIRRRLGQVNMELQENKAVNLALAAPKINGVVLWPGQTFSFWRLVGRCTARKGYKTGMTISNGRTGQGVGGGMCQFTNPLDGAAQPADHCGASPPRQPGSVPGFWPAGALWRGHFHRL